MVALNIKRIVKSRWPLLILLLAAIILACAFFQAEQPIIRIKAGVVCSDDMAEMLFALTDGGVISFERFADAGELEDMVKTCGLECGYIISDSITDNLSGAVTLVRSPGTVADALINEVIYASLLEAAMPHIALREVRRVFPSADIRDKIEAYYAEDIFVKANYSGELGAAEQESRHFQKRAVHGLISLLLLVLVLFTLPKFIAEKHFVKKIYGYYLSVFLSLFAVTFSTGAAGLVACGIMYPPALAYPPLEAAMLALYAAAVCAMGVFLVLILKNSDIIYAGYIFAALLTVCFGGILADMREISAPLSVVSNFFVTTGYVNFIVNGELKYLALLLFNLILFLLFSLLIWNVSKFSKE